MAYLFMWQGAPRLWPEGHEARNEFRVDPVRFGPCSSAGSESLDCRHGPIARALTHSSALRCVEDGIEHRLTKVHHPRTNGQVERTIRTIKDATVRRFHHDSHDQFSAHPDDAIAAYNLARRLKTLRGRTPCENICEIWTAEPESFDFDPTHQMPGPTS